MRSSLCGEFHPAQHAGNFFGPGGVIKYLDPSSGLPLIGGFADLILVVG